MVILILDYYNIFLKKNSFKIKKAYKKFLICKICLVSLLPLTLTIKPGEFGQQMALHRGHYVIEIGGTV
jgi:hypothetical protein